MVWYFIKHRDDFIFSVCSSLATTTVTITYVPCVSESWVQECDDEMTANFVVVFSARRESSSLVRDFVLKFHWKRPSY